MSTIAPVAATSIGHALDVVSAGNGVVQGVYAHAVNLEVRGDLWTLLAAGLSDLPFGIRTALQDPGFAGLRIGDPVFVRSGFVGIGTGSARIVVDCRMATRWVPAAPGELAPNLDWRLDAIAAAVSGRAWHHSAAMAHAVVSALDHEGSLDNAVARVIGRGPGLTPAGDDVLAGILAVLLSPRSGPRGASAAATLAASIRPLLLTTTAISGHLLRQAADGLLGRSVHELISALVDDPPPGQLRAAVRRVVATGATSGADVCAGILAAARPYFLPHRESVAA